MAGAFSALTGTSVWLMVATFFNLPVSGTHSIVGATIGYALVAFKGPKGVSWATFGKIGELNEYLPRARCAVIFLPKYPMQLMPKT